jgi:YD repeat-containing protein
MRFLGLFLLATAAWADSSGTPRPADQELRDLSGRLLKRVDSWRRETLYSYDDRGQVVQIACSRGGWSHLFSYGPEGLSEEVDCRGILHRFESPRPINLERATALADHRHGAVRAPTARFAYDLEGRLKTHVPTGARHD